MSRPKLLDLFCGAGGCSVGYHRAGFDVVGVDHKPQPRYPFEFHQADVFDWLDINYDRVKQFAVVHASPPCQAYSAANNIHGREDHPDLIESTRCWLNDCARKWVIENVPRSPLLGAVQICGLAFGLGVRRHRWFESSEFLFGTECGNHKQDYVIVFGGAARGRAHQTGVAKGGGPVLYRSTIPLERAKAAMGIDWMTRDELSQAIPPAYTEYIGKQLREIIRREFRKVD